MKQQGLILIVLLSFACFAAASDEYCPFNPSGECPGFKSDTAQKSGDTFFYCDTGASMFGSDTCRYLGVIDGRYPVSTGVCPNGYPILFFSTGTVDDLSVDVAYVNCLDYGCTEVSEPKLLPGFNGLYAVDTAIVSINDVETLVVAGVTDQISAEQLGDQQGSTWWSVQYPQYEVVLAFSTDDMCTNFTVNQPDLNEAYVLNPRISSKLVQITATSNPSFPYGITYVTVSPTLSNYNEIIDNNQLGYSGPTPGPTPGPPARKAGKKAQQAAFADEAEKADKPDSDKANSVFGAQESLQRNAHFQNMLSCWGYCDVYYGTSVWIPSSRYMSQFSSDLPWTNNFPSLNQQSDFYDLPAGSAYENFYRTLPDSPFSYNTFLPRPLLLHNKKGDFFFGLQAVQRMPASDIRGLNECGNIEDPESADYREADSSLETSSPYSRFARKVASLTQNLFGGTTNVRFYRCPSATTTEQEAPGFCEGLFEEEEAPITDPIPHPNAALQYSGRSTIHGYKLRDATEEEESETAGENIEDTQEENFDYNNPGDDFWTEAANSYSDNTPLCTESYPTSLLKMVEHQDDDMKHSPGTQRTLGGTRPTRVLGGSRATRSSPRSLTVGLAGNGLPALVGISTVSTGEPSAAGWSLVLSVCLTESCDQQVFRYLMDSSALHDNWGIMDDPFAAVNQILNHPDGSWSIVLFVQPQGEQIDRHTDLPRGEGSTGKPLIINCLDETCSSAYVSLLAPNRLQSTLPSDQTFLTMPSYPTITNDVHSFTYVGEANEYLLVTVRDIPMGPYQYANTNPSGTPYYTPSAVRLWKTNRYASPTGYPCTAESVGTMETIDGSLFICTRLNTGHDLTMGDISGWVRYYEWVDVGHSFASRLWANLPAGRSPLELSPWNNPASEAPLFAPLTSGLSRAANKQTASKATTAAASSGLIAGQPLACCDQQVWTPAPGQHADIALETPVFAGAVKIYFSSLDVPSMLPLAGFYVSLIDANGASTPVLKGFPTLIHGGEFYCQVLVIPIKSTGKATPTSSLRVGLSFLQTTQDSCESDSQPCKIAIAGVEVVAAPASFSSVAPFFAPFPADLAPADIKSGSWPCVVPQ